MHKVKITISFKVLRNNKNAERINFLIRRNLTIILIRISKIIMHTEINDSNK